MRGGSENPLPVPFARNCVRVATDAKHPSDFCVNVSNRHLSGAGRLRSMSKSSLEQNGVTIAQARSVKLVASSLLLDRIITKMHPTKVGN